ncbi:FAD-binding protein [Venustampulla echinocandica]|uniref:FAD-binding protein n=1 Tax=Venustampulla echinocandica TaxID=2656787 RepID=A0A370TZV2_9HELO|nr:FAD-binding protein [Venustampulla echinocandica]RDL41053.1 FAD-binding protein [Venustampulla echinocandica]
MLLTINSYLLLLPASIKPFNLRLPFTPVAVAVPSTVAQVQAAVACGAHAKVLITANSGGHSYASHGLRGEDGHLMIDMRLFNDVTVESSSGIAVVGVGGRLGNIAQSLFNNGERAVSHGTCPGVGIGGHVIGGGYGFSSRTHGLALDNLVEAQVVLANSTVVTASVTENSDLFWAIRGAGASYGIITNYKFQTYPAPAQSITFQYPLNLSQKEVKAVYMTLQHYASTTMPGGMSMRLFVNADFIALMGVFYGTKQAFQTAIQPILRKVGNPTGEVSQMGYLDTLSTFAYGNLTLPLDYDVHETFFSKSLMTAAVTDAVADAFWAYLPVAKSVKREWFLLIDLHGGPSSAISKVPANATSYAHRHTIFKYEFYDRVTNGTYPSDGFSFFNDWVATITNTMNPSGVGMYINYADPTLTTEEAQHYYWLDHYSRLEDIKKAYDPTNIFSNPQSVGRGN